MQNHDPKEKEFFCSTKPECLYAMERYNKCAFCNSFNADTSREQQ
jgi:hypothetical protein